MTDMKPAAEAGRTRITLECPTRGLLGYRNVFFTDTKGSGIMTRAFKGFEPYKGDLEGIRKGVLVSMKSGSSTLYSLDKLQARGLLFIPPGAEVYPGMIIGEHSRDNDLEVNCVEAKQLTNMRAAGSDAKAKVKAPFLERLRARHTPSAHMPVPATCASYCHHELARCHRRMPRPCCTRLCACRVLTWRHVLLQLPPPIVYALEELIPYMQPDEMAEVTPNNLRLRKQVLDSNDRKKSTKTKDLK